MAEDKQKKGPVKAEEPTKTKIKKKGKTKRRSVTEGCVYIKAAFNNTIVSVTEADGSVIASASAGSSGFRGARKGTPYAAQVAAENAVEKAKVFGLERVHVVINGAGPGREQAVRGIIGAGIAVESITDTTTLPHNGCRKKKARRV